MKTVLITGAAGFIGSNLVRHLLSETDLKIIGFDSLTGVSAGRALKDIDSPRFELIVGNLLDQELLDKTVASVDTVVHLAAETHNDFSISNPRAYLESNVVGTFNLLEAVRKHDVRLHHVSTDEVFGDLDFDDEAFSENSNYKPSSPYSSSKASSDLLVRAWHRTYGLQVTLSNCSNNYGKYQTVEKFIPRQITNVLQGLPIKIYGSGENIRDWIHVDDHCAGLQLVLEKGKIGETYLFGGDNERSNLQIAETIVEKLSISEDSIQFVPDRPGHDLRYAIDSSKAKTELGWAVNHSSFDNDLIELFDWYRNNEEFWIDSKEQVEKRY
jgi:dTDP-glucose 4,6-dehydratase